MKSLLNLWLSFPLFTGMLFFATPVCASDLALQSSLYQDNSSRMSDNPEFDLYFGRNKPLSEQFELGLYYGVLKGRKAQIGIGVNAGLPTSNALRQGLELGSSLYGKYQIKRGLNLGIEGAMNHHYLENDSVQNLPLDAESHEVRYDITLSLEPARLFNKPGFKNIHVKASVSDNLSFDEFPSMLEKPSIKNNFDLGDDTKFYLDFDYRY